MDNQQAIDWRLRATKIESYCSALPATIVAQGLGGFYLLWALWPLADHSTLLTGLALLGVVMAAGFVLYRLQQGGRASATQLKRLAILVVGYSFMNGCFWGSAAFVLYPPADIAYAPLVFVLLCILPFVPVAAMAGFLPAFFAYLIPVALPFWLSLALPGDRPGISAAILLTMLLVAASRFAIQYNQNLVEATRLRFTVEQQKEHLEQANRDKAKFMAAASHDLRQPLHTLSLLTDALERHVTSEPMRDLHRRLGDSTDAMYGLLNAMLDISKLDAGVVDVEQTNFPIGALLQRLGAELVPQARAKDLSLSVVPTSLIVRSDPILLEQLLRNLILNAIHYTQQGGVVLGCRLKGEACLIQVVDSGIGIASENVERIFDEFVQLHNPERDRRKGIGLGLANAKRISELLEHPITVSSQLRAGSTFSLRVPRASHVEEAAVEVLDPTPEYSIQDAVLLVIDDELEIRHAMEQLAQSWSCRVVTAASGCEALAALELANLTPDAMIADYRLRDDATGIEAIALVREHLQRHIPALIVTGDTGKEALQDVRMAGHTLVHKPVRPGQLKAMLAYAVAEAEEVVESEESTRAVARS